MWIEFLTSEKSLLAFNLQQLTQDSALQICLQLPQSLLPTTVETHPQYPFKEKTTMTCFLISFLLPNLKFTWALLTSLTKAKNNTSFR